MQILGLYNYWIFHRVDDVRILRRHLTGQFG